MSLVGYFIYSIDPCGVYYIFIVFEEAFVDGYSPFNSPDHSISHYIVFVDFWEKRLTNA